MNKVITSTYIADEDSHEVFVHQHHKDFIIAFVKKTGDTCEPIRFVRQEYQLSLKDAKDYVFALVDLTSPERDLSCYL